ncbi:MAG: VWA domain-containing protein [Deltaproteobacteria bacterium]|nr:VWA domain-containing protein [Deltaproteobacteria bacterium]
MKRRKFNVFSLSFIDCICCGLGAIILLFVVVNAKSAVRRDAVTADLRAEVSRLKDQVLDAKKNLVEARNTLLQTEAELVTIQGRSREVIEVVYEKKVELADRDKETLSTKAHTNRLKADLKSLEEELSRLKAGAKTRDELGSRLHPFPGHGDRQYLTDLKMGGKRIFILVDASASMLDQTIVGIIRRRNLKNTQKLRAPKWRQVIKTIDWLLSQLPPTSNFQIYTFNETARPLVEETKGIWLDAGALDQLNLAADSMQRLVPEKGTSLLNAFKAIGEMKPSPDNIFLLSDSLPTLGSSKPWQTRVSSKKRIRLFNEAIQRLPARVPVNIILYPMEGDPLAADAYWRLAKKTKGAFFCPSRNWP